MRVLWLVVVMTVVSAGLTAEEVKPWSREVGVIDYYAKYSRKPPDEGGKRRGKACCDAIQSLSLTPERVDADIFLTVNRPKRNEYKRLVIHADSEWFSRVLLEGMDDYVRSGGLLITNVSLILEDVNGNYMVDAADQVSDYAQTHFLGVRGHASCSMNRLKITQDSPLTRELPVDSWITLPISLGGRQTTAHGADTLVVSNRLARDQETEQPFLTFRHTDKGACIYLVGPLDANAGEQYRQIVRNLFSRETLDWLCLQE